MNKYFKEYKWENIFEMIKNQKLEPKKCKEDFENRLVVITGATSGIGYETAKKYASCKANLLTINRNEEKSKKLCDEIIKIYNVKCNYLIADFSKLNNVKNVAKQLLELNQDIDVIIHNAGVYNTEKLITEDQMEMVFQTNYLSTFIINYIIKEKLSSQSSSRIIYVNSEAHRFAAWGLNFEDLFFEKQKYSGLKSYGYAKLAQLLSIIKFNEYFIGTNVTINAMHPGNVKTNSGQNNGEYYKLFKKYFIDSSARDLDISAEALYYLGVSKEVEKETAKFFNLTTIEVPAPPALDFEAAKILWEISKQLGEFQ